MSVLSRRSTFVLLAAVLAATLAFVTMTRQAGSPVIRIGAAFPLQGAAGLLAQQELMGVQIAADLVNADGGVGGRKIEVVLKDLESASDAPGVMEGFAHDGITAVVGAYSSDLSIAASRAAQDAGLVYWESGAVADRLTGRGLPLVFRVGASGTNLGADSATFAASQLASRLGRTASTLRTAIVNAQDDYATSVADSAAQSAAADGVPVVLRESYNLEVPDWPKVMADLAAAKPDVIILASHIPDGVAFRRAMLAAHLRVGALIGSTMAECDPDFAGELGADAVGIFASDRPTSGFQPGALDPAALAAYDRFVAARSALGSSTASATAALSEGSWSYRDGSQGGSSTYPISGPSLPPTADADEEALAGFTAGWALFHDVLPATAGGQLDATSIAATARSIDLPTGALPNGAGLRFSTDPATLGQNTRASAVIWQWQSTGHYEFVWPPSYATAPIALVPLPR
jgi:branched-chain amino acid transport system substrate-binding protein